MREELRVINAVVGMAVGGGGWPAPLKSWGYVLTSIQRPVSFVQDGKTRTVVPEAVLQSHAEECSILVESKSSSFDDSQAKRYLALRPADLVANAAIREPDDLDAHVAAPIYFCSAIHSESLTATISFFNESNAEGLPLVDYDNHRFALATGRVRNPRLHKLFDGGVHFTEATWPTRFVPFDADSPESEVVASVMAELGALLFEPGVEEFSVEQLASGHSVASTEGAVPHYRQLGQASKRRFRGQLSAMVEDFRRSYGSDYYERVGNEKAWRKRRTIEPGPAFQSFRVKSADFSRRVQEGLPLPKDTQKPALISQADLESAAEPESKGDANG